MHPIILNDVDMFRYLLEHVDKLFISERYTKRNEYKKSNSKSIEDLPILKITKDRDTCYGAYVVHRAGGVKEIYSCGSGRPFVSYTIKSDVKK